MIKISYALLNSTSKNAINDRLEVRKNRFLSYCTSGGYLEDYVLLVGDRPGPSAPKDSDYHHTPFYSVKHCSGWLNTSLHLEEIPEEKLVWINSADKDGVPTDAQIIKNSMPTTIVALGGNASTWLKRNGIDKFIFEYHPQYWKRFKNNQRYKLLDMLKLATT